MLDEVERSAEPVEKLVRCFNLCALLELHAGRPDRARLLCQTQLSWIASLLGGSHLRGFAAYAFQPWINLARLCRIEGRPNDALDLLSVIRNAYETKSVSLGEISVSREEWPSLKRLTPALEHFLAAVWTCEQLLIGLKFGRFELFSDVDNFIEVLAAPDLKIASVEAAMLAECLPNGPVDPRIGSVVFDASISDLQLHALALRKFALMKFRGTPATAYASQVKGIAGFYRAFPPEPWRLAIIQHSAALLLDSEADDTIDMLEAGYSAAVAIDDQPSIAWFAKSGMEATCGMLLWKERVESLRMNSWYAVIRDEEHFDMSLCTKRLDELMVRVVQLAHRT